jgi:hypothetical protein
VFFTTDLNARLAWPGQWQWTRNAIIASHYGPELHPRLQAPIPPFRDGYQTSLFYTALWALDHFVPAGKEKPDCPDCFRLRATAGNQPQDAHFSPAFSPDAGPRLFEVGRSGPFDISVDKWRPPAGVASIHPPRPDMERWERWSGQVGDLKWTGVAVAGVVLLVFAAMLLSATVTQALIRLASSRFFWWGLASALAISFGLLGWTRKTLPNAAEAEPFVLAEGISAWPTALIRLLALAAALVFLVYSWWKLKKNENILERDFDLRQASRTNATAASRTNATAAADRLTGPGCPDDDAEPRLAHEPEPGKPAGPSLPSLRKGLLHRIAGLHFWPSRVSADAPTAAGETARTEDRVDATRLWQEYAALGGLPEVAARCLPQVALAMLFAYLNMTLLGFPNTPCRGKACFEANHVVVMLGVGAMTLLVFYVIDVIRLCRRWVNCIAAGNVTWPEETLAEIADQQGRSMEASKHYLEEWLGIELIGRRTRVIGNLIYFPFVVMFLLAIARHAYFDNWDFPTALVIVFTVNAILIIIAALILRRAAAMAKKEALARLEKQRNRLSGETPREAQQRGQIEWAIEAIRNNQTGAFLPFTRHPIFGASVAMPSGAYGIVLLVEYLATAF